MSVQTKAVVTVAEMARMCGLSRSRFYQLVEAGVFPPPVYGVATRRPMYDEGQQRTCLEVRRRNCGVNGRPVLFYARGHRPAPAARPATATAAKPKPAPAAHADLLAGLAALGLPATAGQVGAAVASLFPAGAAGADPGEVLRAVFLHLKRQNPAGSAGR